MLQQFLAPAPHTGFASRALQKRAQHSALLYSISARVLGKNSSNITCIQTCILGTVTYDH